MSFAREARESVDLLKMVPGSWEMTTNSFVGVEMMELMTKESWEVSKIHVDMSSFRDFFVARKDKVKVTVYLDGGRADE